MEDLVFSFFQFLPFFPSTELVTQIIDNSLFDLFKKKRNILKFYNFDSSNADFPGYDFFQWANHKSNNYIFRSSSISNRTPSDFSSKADNDRNANERYSQRPKRSQRQIIPQLSDKNLDKKKKKKHQISYPSSSSEQQRILKMIQEYENLIKVKTKNFQNANASANKQISQLKMQMINAARDGNIWFVNWSENKLKQVKQQLLCQQKQIKEMMKKKEQLNEQLKQHRLLKKFPSIK